MEFKGRKEDARNTYWRSNRAPTQVQFSFLRYLGLTLDLVSFYFLCGHGFLSSLVLIILPSFVTSKLRRLFFDEGLCSFSFEGASKPHPRPQNHRHHSQHTHHTHQNKLDWMM